MLSCLAVWSFQRTTIIRYTVAVADFGSYRFSQRKVARRDDKKFFERFSQKTFFALRGEIRYDSMRPDGYGKTNVFFEKRNTARPHAGKRLRGRSFRFVDPACKGVSSGNWLLVHDENMER